MESVQSPHHSGRVKCFFIKSSLTMRRKGNEQKSSCRYAALLPPFLYEFMWIWDEVFWLCLLHIQGYFSIVVIFMCLCYPMFKNTGLEVVSWFTLGFHSLNIVNCTLMHRCSRLYVKTEDLPMPDHPSSWPVVGWHHWHYPHS